jgi:hypothetical protein
VPCCPQEKKEKKEKKKDKKVRGSCQRGLLSQHDRAVVMLMSVVPPRLLQPLHADEPC